MNILFGVRRPLFGVRRPYFGVRRPGAALALFGVRRLVGALVRCDLSQRPDGKDHMIYMKPRSAPRGLGPPRTKAGTGHRTPKPLSQSVLVTFDKDLGASGSNPFASANNAAKICPGTM